MKDNNIFETANIVRTYLDANKTDQLPEDIIFHLENILSFIGEGFNHDAESLTEAVGFTKEQPDKACGRGGYFHNALINIAEKADNNSSALEVAIRHSDTLAYAAFTLFNFGNAKRAFSRHLEEKMAAAVKQYEGKDISAYLD